MPSRSGFQLAREKNAWARSWDQVRVNPLRRPAQRCGHRSVEAADSAVQRQKSRRVSSSKEFVRGIHLRLPGTYQNSLFDNFRALCRDTSGKGCV
jgi:hypothetical protein